MTVSILRLAPAVHATGPAQRRQIMPFPARSSAGSQSGSCSTRSNHLWSYVDSRDVAQAARLAAEHLDDPSLGPGNHPFNVGAGDAHSRLPLSEIIPQFIPDLTSLTSHLTGTTPPSASSAPRGSSRGEIWSVELPNQPPDTHTPRPALVLSIDVRNRLANDVIIVPLSTKLRPLPTHVSVPAGVGGQHRDSIAKCEHVTTLDKRFLVRGPFAGRLPEPLLGEVTRAVRRAIGEVLP